MGLTSLLTRIRSIDGLVEKSPGVFYRKSKAFLHFHEDPEGPFVDVRIHVDEPSLDFQSPHRANSPRSSQSSDEHFLINDRPRFIGG